MKKLFSTAFLLALFALSAQALSAQTDARVIKLPYADRSTHVGNRERTSITSFKPDEPVLAPTSTIVFEESFEGTTGFPPAGWKIVDMDGGGSTAAWFQGNTSVFTAYDGTGYAAANYQGATDFLIDQWLISPRIMSITVFDTLSFYNRSPDNSIWDDSLEVRISVTDTAISSFTIKLDYFKTSTSGWQQKRYPLKNYVTTGSNIYVAIRYLLTDAGVSGTSSDYAAVDLVQILRPQVARDMRVASIDFPTNGTKIPAGQTFDPAVTFQNAGTTGLSNIPTMLRIYPPQGELYEKTQSIDSLSAGQSRQLIFDSYVLNVPGIYTVRAYSLLGGDQNTANDSLQVQFRDAILLSGTFSVGVGGDIQTIRQALDSLNNNFITGDITLSLINSTYNEPPLSLGPLDYLYIPYKILIKPAAFVTPTINVTATAAEYYGFAINGASNITLNGSNADIDRRDLTINANGINAKIGIMVQGKEGASSDSNTIKNIRVRTGADSLSTADGYFGVLVSGYRAEYPDAGNRVINCDITRHGSAGVAARWQEGLRIERSFIHDWTQAGGTNEVCGIWLADGAVSSTVSGNFIGNLKNSINFNWACGIENGAGPLSSALICNNMIYGILSSGPGTDPNYSRGIYSSSTENAGDCYYFNSIYMTGSDASTAPSSRTTGFEFTGGSSITVKNNIVYNSTSIGGTGPGNKDFCVYLPSVPSNFNSNNNDFYAPGAQGAVGFNSETRTTLAEWKSSFSPAEDSLSLSADPLFVSPSAGNLHIQTNMISPVNNAGTFVPAVTTDIDGATRNPVNPDIGADEFTPGESTISVTYNTGWNMVSVPLIEADYRKTSLFPASISSAFSYGGTYMAESTLANGEGYWLKFGSPQINEMTGSSITSDTIQVKESWNLIGSITAAVSIASIVQVPPGNVITSYYSYTGGYTAVNTLEPGWGYWVKVKSNGSLRLSASQVTPKADFTDLSLLNELRIGDKSGHAQTLYVGEADQIMYPPERYEMPPAAPSFDARFRSGLMVETIPKHLDAKGNLEYQIAIRADEYPLTLNWKFAQPSERKFFITNGNKLVSLLEGTGSVILLEPVSSLNLKILGKNLVPTQYSLSQNFPNPFNPTTLIRYALPEADHVTLTVYDLLGRQVATLVNEIMQAGEHAVTWHSEGMPSGVYVYRLTARPFVQTKKMVLLR